MSDEIAILTENEAGDGWVDSSPGEIDTGYQAQNLGFTALFNGLDNSAASVSGSNLILSPSGIIDINGMPFIIKSQITLTLPTSGVGPWFVKLIAGTTSLEKSAEFTNSRGTYDASKNGWYSASGERVLNWVYNRYSGRLTRLTPDDQDLGTVNDDITQNGFMPANRVLPAMWGMCAKQWSITSGVACKGLSYYDGYLYNLGDTIEKYNLEGTLLSSIAIALDATYTGYYCSTIDRTTGNLIRIAYIHPGGIPSTFPTYVLEYSGISSTILNTIYLGVIAAGTACEVDGDGNLLYFRSGSGDVRVYDGISSTLDTTLTADADTKRISWDFYGRNAMTIEVDSTPETEIARISLYDGNTDTIIAFTALPNLFEIDGDSVLGFSYDDRSGECAVCNSTTILRLGVFR